MEEERDKLRQAFEGGEDLRVIDLRRLLALYRIPHSAKLRKHQLVQLCKDEIAPRPEISENVGKRRLRVSGKRSQEGRQSKEARQRSQHTQHGGRRENSREISTEESTDENYNDSDAATPKQDLKIESTPNNTGELIRTPTHSVKLEDTSSSSPHPFLSSENVFQSKKRSLPSNDQRSLKRQRLASASALGAEGDNSSQINISLDLDPNLLAANSTALDGVEDARGSGASDSPKSHQHNNSITPVSYSPDVSEIDTPSPRRQSQPLILRGPVGSINDSNVLFRPNSKSASSPAAQTGKNVPNGAVANKCYVHSPDLSLDDSNALTHLLSEIECEKSRIELESERGIEELNSTLKSRFVQRQVVKFLVGFVSFSFILKCLLVYLRERTLVGFCGYEIRQRWINADNFPPQLADIISTVNQWHLQCVPCPANAQCSANSVLSCVADYTVSKPLLWSFAGLVPTYNECVLDSAKLKRINTIIRLVVNVLAARNASFHCGDGTDQDVGLTWDQLVEFASDRLSIDPHDDYYWSKVHAALVGLPDLTFNNGLVRSHSLSKLSISCRLKRSVLTLMYRLRYYLASLILLALLLSIVFYKINRWQRRKESVRDLTQKVLLKLQEQSKQFRLKHVERKFLGKIQLRDYYLPQLRMSKADRLAIWNAVVTRVEENSNVKITDEEVDGDIMRVWQWTLDVI